MTNYFLHASNFNGIEIIQVHEHFARTASGKSWSKKPIDREEETITAEQYLNVVLYPWKGDRTERSYTYAGYIPVKVSNISPDGSVKCVWSWSFKLA